MTQLLRQLIFLSAFSLGVNAHIEMRWPYAFRSKFNPNNTNPDYDNTSPLLADGSNYPCKGYQDLASSQTSVVTYTPGQTYNLTLAGMATHGGGSCQLSLSYDDGQSFHVIKSMIGGCPTKEDWDFTIPSYAPPSNSVILAWTWFNLIGNREMYMNCARVSITGQSVQRYRRTSSKRQTSIEQLPENFACNIGNGCATLEDHEVIFPNPGNVVERGTDLYNPLPGPGYTLTATPTGTGFNGSASTAWSLNATYTPRPYSSFTNGTLGPRPTATDLPPFLIYSNDSTLTASRSTNMMPSYISTITITTTVPVSTTVVAGLTVSDTVTFYTAVVYATTISTIVPRVTAMPGAFYSNSTWNATSSSVYNTTLPPYANTTSTMNVNTTTISYVTSMLTGFVTSTLLPNTTSTTSTSTASPIATIIPGLCVPGAFTCNSITSFSQCVGGSNGTSSYIYMGSVAAGMQCVNGSIIRQNNGPCTPDGSLQCEGSTSFYLCTNGGLIDMGPVAAGTTCSNGTIVSL